MTLDELANIGELVGAIAVVISLVYLALQIRQSTKAQLTENYTRALERVSNMQALWSQDAELTMLITRGVDDPARLTPQDRIRLTYAMLELFGAFEFMHHAHKDGVMPDKVWERWSETVAWWLSFKGVREWWENLPVSFTEDFSEYVEAILGENPTDPAAVERWQRFVAGEPDAQGPDSP